MKTGTFFDEVMKSSKKLPGVGSAAGFGAKKEEKELYYSFTNYVTPGSTYKFEIESGTSELFRKPDIDFNP